MNRDEFRTLLQGAMIGNKDDIEVLFQLYRPLIDGNSYIRGKLDEDLRQYIIMHLIKNISKFSIK